MKPIKLQNGLWAVSVPADSKELFTALNKTALTFRDESQIKSVMFGFAVEILGTVDKDTISFDVHPYCENDPHNIRKYKLYPDGATNFNKISFRSLLSSHGLTDYEKLIILKEI